MKLYVTDETTETKFERFKREAKKKFRNGVEWLKENKETVILLTPIAIGGLKVVTTIAKTVGQRNNLRREENIKNLYCYDPSLGHYWALKRELTNSEWVNIDKRRKNGERMSEILEELRVLK